MIFFKKKTKIIKQIYEYETTNKNMGNHFAHFP